jgi:coenzyme F420-reducing hydrogenase alpha subunit
MKINVDYVARVEGEGSVKFEIKDGKLKYLKLSIWEPPRFFEGFLVGKYDESRTSFQGFAASAPSLI